MRDGMIGPAARLLGVTAILLELSTMPGALIRRRYGRNAARRFIGGASAAVIAQQSLVALALRGGGDRQVHRLTLVDLLTLSRGSAAAILVGLLGSGVRDRRGLAGWLAWLAVLYGAILCDWLDGPIARHLGTSKVGGVLDLEADSWLTLVTATAATVWGDVPRAVVVPPLLRYGFLASALRTTHYALINGDEPPWVRRLGIAQMLTFIAALAPFGGSMTRFAVRVTAPIQPPLQIGGLVALHRRRRNL